MVLKTSPEPEVKLGGILDIQAIQLLMDHFYALTGFSVSIGDIDGTVLVATGWQDICTKFHSATEDSCALCRESNLRFSEGVAQGEFRVYKCLYNMWNIVTPIIIHGRHLGNLFLGQFLFEDEAVDLNMFLAQAQKHGFPEGDYLAALKIVPRQNREKVFMAMTFYIHFANIISMLGYKNMQLAHSLGENEKLLNTIRAGEEKLRITLQSVGDGVIATDMQGKVELLNTVAERLTGWSQKDALGKELDDVFQGQPVELASHTLLIARDGTQRPIECSAAPIKDAEGEIHGVVHVFRDFTQKRAEEERIRYLSFHDSLTGLYNRRFLEEEIRRLNTDRNLPMSVIMGDANGLKLINDAFGHDRGDLLLKRVADAIHSACRADDIVGRWGGDEFLILLPKTTWDEAASIAQRIQEAYADGSIETMDVSSISFGWDTKANSSQDISRILKSAEDHMYRNKTLERDKIGSGMIWNILDALYTKSEREEQHSRRVAELCLSIGLEMELADTDVAKLKTIGMLHDIGKIAISDTILTKPTELTALELEEVRRHSEIGYRILISSHEMRDVAEAVLAHHEYWDGTGYPKGLMGEAIPLPARIVAVADAYDAMTRQRSYSRVLSEDEAISEINKKAGTQFDPHVTRVLVKATTK